MREVTSGFWIRRHTAKTAQVLDLITVNIGDGKGSLHAFSRHDPQGSKEVKGILVAREVILLDALLEGLQVRNVIFANLTEYTAWVASQRITICDHQVMRNQHMINSKALFGLPIKCFDYPK